MLKWVTFFSSECVYMRFEMWWVKVVKQLSNIWLFCCFYCWSVAEPWNKMWVCWVRVAWGPIAGEGYLGSWIVDWEFPTSRLGCLGEHCKLAGGIWGRSPKILNLVHFGTWKSHQNGVVCQWNFMKGSKKRVCLSYPSYLVAPPMCVTFCVFHYNSYWLLNLLFDIRDMMHVTRL